MNSVAIENKLTNQDITPTQLLEKFSNSQFNGCLQVFDNSLFYLIYFDQGKLIYATNSVDPFERLERHLRNFSHKIPTLTKSIITTIRLKFEKKSQSPSSLPLDYQGIYWLVKRKYLNPREAAQLIISLMQEVFETYLLLPTIAQNSFIPDSEQKSIFCRIKVKTLVARCYKRLQAWQELVPQIWSSYQRPYFFCTSQTKNKLSEQQKKQLSLILKGFNWRQLAALLNQDELRLARKLYPLILDGSIVLRSPQKPFNILPKFSSFSLQENPCFFVKNINKNNQRKTDLVEKKYKITCIDDSITILDNIKQFLDHDKFFILAINDSLKALRDILNIKPDLILLDLSMPNINGYQLCSLIRKHPLLKTIPIVMVTGNKGLINRAKAKCLGATDYLLKPFNQQDLLKIVSMYLH